MSLAGTAIASLCWGTDVLRVVVWTQDTEGYVRDAQGIGNAWNSGGPGNRLFHAKPHTPLAAFGFQAADPKVDPGYNFRLFWVDANNILQEHCFDSGRGWYRGSLSCLNLRVHPQSKLAACSLGNRGCVYFQEPTNAATQEWRWDGEAWAIGTTLPQRAHVGSNLTACYNYGTPRIYYVADDNFIRERTWHEAKGQWTAGLFVYPASPNSTSFAITAAGNDRTTNMYLTWPGGEIALTIWAPGFTLPLQVGTAQGTPGTNLSACTSASNPKFKRVYYETSSQDIVELCNDGGDWYFGKNVPS